MTVADPLMQSLCRGVKVKFIMEVLAEQQFCVRCDVTQVLGWQQGLEPKVLTFP
jgi:hypothetical protein